MNQQPVKKFSDFAKDLPLEGEKRRVEDVLNIEITVTAYAVKTSRFNKTNNPRCLTLQYEYQGKQFVTFSGSNVLIDQIERYKDEMPFSTTIRKIDRYYSFT